MFHKNKVKFHDSTNRVNNSTSLPLAYLAHPNAIVRTIQCTNTFLSKISKRLVSNQQDNPTLMLPNHLNHLQLEMVMKLHNTLDETYINRELQGLSVLDLVRLQFLTHYLGFAHLSTHLAQYLCIIQAKHCDSDPHQFHRIVFQGTNNYC